MSHNLLKVLKMILAICIITTVVLALVISQDEEHLMTCHDEHCIKCNIIHMAQNLSTLIIGLIISLIIGFFINFYLLARMHKAKKIFFKSTLVFQKIQLNE